MISVRVTLIFLLIFPFVSQSSDSIDNVFLDSLLDYTVAINRRYIIEDMSGPNSFPSEAKIFQRIKSDQEFQADIEWDYRASRALNDNLELLLREGRFREVRELGCGVPSLHISAHQHMSITTELKSCFEDQCSNLRSLLLRLSSNAVRSREVVDECIEAFGIKGGTE
jgi:hypothetical protein